MDSEYPPLPPSKGPASSVRVAAAYRQKPTAEEHKKTTKKDSQYGREERERERERSHPGALRDSVTVISRKGDVIVEHLDQTSTTSSQSQGHSQWLVNSEDLIQNSPYFRALLDPNKFSEGRQFMQQKTDWSQKTAAAADKDAAAAERPPSSFSRIVDDGASIHELPKLQLPVDQFTRRLGVDAIEVFLKLLSVKSLDNDNDYDDNEKKLAFESELRILPASLVARLVEIADVFNSPQVAREALKRCRYAYGKGRVPMSKFSQPMLKMSEDRIRQVIYIANFLRDSSTFQVATHSLIVAGSRRWTNGVEPPEQDTFRWTYFSDGLEEELFYRRQCVMNTITDLQAYFLRAYGGLEESTGPKPASTGHPVSVPATSTTIRPREFQCRCGFGNSNACDAFHLGQMVRFFSIRAKTVFLGSSLLDPDFALDSDDDEDALDANGVSSEPPTDITAIIASLKQFPDYQIDSNHTGCGIRRRIIPALDCIERFVGDGRGLLGVSLHVANGDGGDVRSSLSASSWRNRALRRARRVDIHFSRINAVQYTTPGATWRPVSLEEDARLFLTAKKRYWES